MSEPETSCAPTDPPDRSDRSNPIDLVYLWVDGADPAFQALKCHHLALEPGPARRDELAGDTARYVQFGEIAWSIRSVRRFAPWIRTIFIVVAPGQRPPVDLADPRIRIVEHPEIMPADILPTFASRSIEPFVHRIPGLSEVFVYGNDDFLFWRPTPPTHFVDGDRLVLRGRLQPRWRARITAALYAGHTRIVNLTALLLHRHGLRRVVQAEHAFHVFRRSTCERVWAELGPRLSQAVAHRFRDDDNGLNWQMLVYSFEARDHAVRFVRTFDWVHLSFAHVEESRLTAAFVRLRLALLHLWAPRTLCFNTVPTSWHARMKARFERHFGPADEPDRA